MNRFFAKVDLPLDASGVFMDTSDLPCNGEYLKQQKYGVALLRKKFFTSIPNRSYEASEADRQKIVSQLPKNLLEIEVPKLWVLDMNPTDDEVVMLAPHVDGVRVTALNIYSNTHGERTCFYEYVAGGDIREVDSFVARDGDVWLMDVSNPHAVELKPGKRRRVLTISFITTPYEVVREALL
jgi:hypothetical protein